MKKCFLWIIFILLSMTFSQNVYAFAITVETEILSDTGAPKARLWISKLQNESTEWNKTLSSPFEIPSEGTYQISIDNGPAFGTFDVDEEWKITNLTGALALGDGTNVITFDLANLTKVTTKFSEADLGLNRMTYGIFNVNGVLQGDHTYYLPDGTYRIGSYGLYVPFGLLTVDKEAENGPLFTSPLETYDVTADYLIVDSDGNLRLDLNGLTKVTITRGKETDNLFSLTNHGVEFWFYDPYTFHAVPGSQYDVKARGNNDIFGSIMVNADGSVSTEGLLINDHNDSGIVSFDIEHAPKVTFRFDQLSETVEYIEVEKKTVYGAVYEMIGSAYARGGLFPLNSDFNVHGPGIDKRNNSYGNFFIDSEGYVSTDGFLKVESQSVDENGRAETVLGFETCDMIAVTITPKNDQRFWFHSHFSSYDATINYLPSGQYRLYSDGGNLLFSVDQNGLSILEDNGISDIVELSSAIDQCQPDDTDADAIPDDVDNCVEVPNPSQVDQDLDGIGDLCDEDIDGDDVLNEFDNCSEQINTDQQDSDGDGIGDVCDDDADGDSVNDSGDNCLGVSNPNQFDSDGDFIGDACDIDDDNDTVNDDEDNCQFVQNINQEDYDGDGEGDVCDGDVDNDGIDNATDQCPNTPLSIPIYTNGCSGLQHIALMCQKEDFSNHGTYVSCVAHTAREAYELGLITNKERGRIVSRAAKNK